MPYDTRDYDRQVHANAQRAQGLLEDANRYAYRKQRDERGLEIIATGLATIRSASGAAMYTSMSGMPVLW